ncbi:MAG: hypothetical protein MMC23_007228 [Stictis urceolatum]|nr:hypothetical protein [Stictis urceolata]
MSSSPVAIIAGVGPGTGASVAKKFAQKYPVVLMARSPENYESLVKEIESSGGKATGISTDVTSTESVKKAFEQVKSIGPVAAVVFNVGGRFVRKPFLELTEDEFDAGFSANGYVLGVVMREGVVLMVLRHGAFLFSQQAIPLLLEHVSGAEHPPTLIFTGATASLKGSALCASFATGKFAMRALAQSLGREFGPKGVHVSHAIIDGVIDIPRTKEWKFDAPDAKISPDAIADSYWYLHTQPRTTFTNEIDIRPYVEKW